MTPLAAAFDMEQGVFFRLTQAPYSLDIIDYETNAPEDMPELIVGDYGSSPGLTVYGNTGSGFGAGFIFNSATPNAVGYVLQADINGDGLPDVAHLTKTVEPGIPQFRWWSKTDQQGNYFYEGGITVTNDADFGGPITDGSSFDVADFNQDGRPDILMASAQEVSVFLRNADATYTRIVVFRGYSIDSFHIVDLDLDSHPDLLTNQGGMLGMSYWIPADGTFFEIRELPNGNIEAFWTPLVSLGRNVWVDTADISGDGRPELFVPTNITWYPGQSTGLPFDLNTPNVLGFVAAESILIEDINDDGEPDLMAIAQGKLWTAEGSPGAGFRTLVEEDSGNFTNFFYLSSYDRRIHVAEVYDRGVKSIVLPPMRINNSFNGTMIYRQTPPIGPTNVEVNLGSHPGYAPFLSEGLLNPYFEVTIDQPAPYDTTVDITYTDDTAVRLTDYLVVTSTATILAGDTSVQVPIDIPDNSEFDGNRSCTVTISNATPAPGNPIGGATLGPRTSAVVTIADDEFISLEPVDFFTTFAEDAGTVSIGLQISSSINTFPDKVVNYETATLSPGDGVATADMDFVSTSGSLTFTSDGQILNVPIDITDDDSEEGTETFLLRLSSADPNLQVYEEITITIEDNDFLTFEDALDLAGVTNPLLRLPDADASGDGNPNLLVYAIGFNITDKSPEIYNLIRLTTGVTIGEFGALIFSMPEPARGDILYKLYQKIGIEPWTIILTKVGRDPWTGSAPYSIFPTAPGFVTVRVGAGPGSPILFRLTVEQIFLP